ncbi:MAG: response regulator [Pirellulaceae bacterium]|nr:response regulator [Pirellulaceae bacterium]
MDKTILLCDDEPAILRPTEYTLQRDGLNVLCATDGEEAWQLICSNQIDVVVTDWQMPRMDGLTLVEKIRQHSQTVTLPVIMVSARSQELLDSQRIKELQLAAIIDKPYSPRELNHCIKRIVEIGPFDNATYPSQA